MKRILIAFACWLAASAGAAPYVIGAPAWETFRTTADCPAGHCANFNSSMSLQGRFEFSEPLKPNLNSAIVTATYTISDGVTVYSNTDPQMMSSVFFLFTDANANVIGVNVSMQRWQRPKPHAAGDRFDQLFFNGYSASASHNLICRQVDRRFFDSDSCSEPAGQSPGESSADLPYGRLVDHVKLTPVVRFYNEATRAHFFTANMAERDHVIATYPVFAYEGTAFLAQDRPQYGAVPVYRFYNTASGAHFYTVSEAERAEVIKNYPTYLYEGPAWYGYTKPIAGTTAVHRFWRTDIHSHFYTSNQEEMEFMRANYPAFNYEGVGYYTWKTAP